MTPGRSIRQTILSQLVWLGVAVVVVPTVTAAFKHFREGMIAPKVSGKNILDNTSVSTEKLVAENKVVVVVFWASWSERSVEELLYMKGIVSRWPDQPLRVVAVNVEGQTMSAPKRQEIVDLVTELQLPFPVIIDKELEIFYKFGVIAVPSTAIVDSKGVLRSGPAGYSLTTRDLISDSIEALLGLGSSEEVAVIHTGYEPTDRAMRYYNLALNLFRQRMYERTLSNLDLAIADDSGFSAAHSLRGETFLMLNQSQEAAHEFGLAVTLDSSSVAAWTGWGKALMAQDDFDGAFVRISAALELDNSYTPAFLFLAFLLAKQGNSEAALDSLAKARDLNQRDPDTYYYLGRVYMLANDTAKAAVAYEKALEILYPSR